MTPNLLKLVSLLKSYNNLILSGDVSAAMILSGDVRRRRTNPKK
jgi:hypothetical protein